MGPRVHVESAVLYTAPWAAEDLAHYLLNERSQECDTQYLSEREEETRKETCMEII